MADVDIVRITFKGGAPALIALLAGETQVMFGNSGGVGSHIKAGNLRALAVTTAQRSALFPDLPTIAAAGLPGYEASSAQCIFAPAGMAPVLIERLHGDIKKVLTAPEAKERFLRAGSEVVAGTPDELAAYIKADMIKTDKIVKAAGIRAN